MNPSNNLRSINPKEFISHNFNPYILSNQRNQRNNPLTIYLSSSLNESKTKIDYNTNNNVKKLNINISSNINNSVNQDKKGNNNFINKHSSFNSQTHNSNINKFNEKGKKTLILDLDETLVHSAFTPFSRKSDIVLNINIEGEDRTLYVLKRPYVDKFLYEMSSLYEIIIFTASISPYANPLLDELDKNKFIKYRLFREHCTFDNGIYIKDLKIFDRKINNMIIIDNNPISYDNNIENGIPILSWYENSNDNELLKLIPLLKYLSNPIVPDVRNIINQIVDRNKNEIDYSKVNRIITSNSKDENTYQLSSNELTTQNKYRRNNKSEEPKSKVSNNNKFNKNVYGYNFNIRNNGKPLKNNYAKKYNNENKNNNISNKKNTINNINIYNIQNKENITNLNNININIDKMDPYGTRTSIFSPEEYNISYTNKSLNYSYGNRNKLEMNNIEDNNFITSAKPHKVNEDYLLDNYRNKLNYYNLTSKKEVNNRSYTPNIHNTRKKELEKSNEENLNINKVSKKLSLIELTKKALHLFDDEYIDKNKNGNEYETINNNSKTSRALYKYNNYFNKENQIIYNDYINNNKFVNNYKVKKDLIDNSKKNYYKNYIEEQKDINDINTNINNENIKVVPNRKENSFNERFIKTDKLFYNNNKIPNKNNKNKLLERINKEKINNFLNNNNNKTISKKLYQNDNYYSNINSEKNYVKNYNQINKDIYFNSQNKTIIKNNNNLNSKLLNINTNEDSIYSNNRYNLGENYENKENSNIMANHKSMSNINDKLLYFKNIKSKKKIDTQINYNQLAKSSSFINLNNERGKLMDKLSVNNRNKENVDNNLNFNLEYGKNLNYKYELINGNNHRFSMNEKYVNNFNRKNFIKY